MLVKAYVYKDLRPLGIDKVYYDGMNYKFSVHVTEQAIRTMY